jgi:hypothetical protein
MSSRTPSWRRTGPLSVADFKCDLCGSEADTVHFWPWVVECEQVLFACSTHDPGGYWTEIGELLSDDAYEVDGMAAHIMRKRDGGDTLAMFEDRVENLRNALAESDRSGATDGDE